jgi:hypothetical protein
VPNRLVLKSCHRATWTLANKRQKMGHGSEEVFGERQRGRTWMVLTREASGCRIVISSAQSTNLSNSLSNSCAIAPHGHHAPSTSQNPVAQPPVPLLRRRGGLVLVVDLLLDRLLDSNDPARIHLLFDSQMSAVLGDTMSPRTREHG